MHKPYGRAEKSLALPGGLGLVSLPRPLKTFLSQRTAWVVVLALAALPASGVAYVALTPTAFDDPDT